MTVDIIVYVCTLLCENVCMTVVFRLCCPMESDLVMR